MGKTRVMAVVTATVVQPRVERPMDGFLNFHCHLPNLADLAFQAGSQRQQVAPLLRTP